MKITQMKLNGIYLIEPKLNTDERGYFTRIFCKDELKKIGIDLDIVQVSRSMTKKKNTIRGMHHQNKPYQEDKIVQCLRGNIYDVAVDLRQKSPTYGQWIAVELSEDNKNMLYIPRGFAHGFQTRSDNCEVLYFMNEYYHSESAAGVRWNDPLLNIKWPIKHPILSLKDKRWPSLNYASPK